MSIKTTSLGPRSENKTILWIKIMEYRYISYRVIELASVEFPWDLF